MSKKNAITDGEVIKKELIDKIIKKELIDKVAENIKNEQIDGKTPPISPYSQLIWDIMNLKIQSDSKPSDEGFDKNIISELLRANESDSYVLDRSEIEKINLIVGKSSGRYKNKDSFIREAIEVMSIFWNNPGPELNMRMKSLWKDLPKETKEYVAKNSPDYFQQMEMESLETSYEDSTRQEFVDFQNKLKNIRESFSVKLCFNDPAPKLKEEHYVYKKSSLVLNNDYDRIFPAKLVLILLAYQILENSKATGSVWIDYSDFRDSVFEKIKKFSYHLKKLEEQNFSKYPENVKIKSRKITIGLPYIDPKDSKFHAIREKSAKNEFLDKYVGPTIRAWQKTIKYNEYYCPPDAPREDKYGYVAGILADLDLVIFKKTLPVETDINKKPVLPFLSISLTRKGLEFLKLENPILDDEHFDKSLSEDEGQFFKKHLIGTYVLEKFIVDYIYQGKEFDRLSNSFEFMDKSGKLLIHDVEFWDSESIMKMIAHLILFLGDKNLDDAYEDKKMPKTHEEFLSSKSALIKKHYDQFWQHEAELISKDKTPNERDWEDFKKWLKFYRISLMGRMSESGLVNWEIEDNKSKYYVLSQNTGIKRKK